MKASDDIFETFLVKEFNRRKSKNSNYSLRSFARDAQLDASTLSQLLKGKRRLSIEKTKTVLERLGVSASARDEILCIILGIDRKTVHRKLTHTAWPSIGDELMATWLCYVILSVFELKDFQSTASWIAKKLGTPLEEVSKVLDLLEEAGLISRKKKPWTFAQVTLTTQPGFQVAAVSQVHAEYLGLSQNYLKKWRVLRIISLDQQRIILALHVRSIRRIFQLSSRK